MTGTRACRGGIGWRAKCGGDAILSDPTFHSFALSYAVHHIYPTHLDCISVSLCFLSSNPCLLTHTVENTQSTLLCIDIYPVLTIHNYFSPSTSDVENFVPVQVNQGKGTIMDPTSV